ncbi:AAA family ATPase [Mycobacterium sp. D16R24]|uniref:AAA family ATPase n=1 Tax=Mycobacterium sp. D16R24 TaxID=1855656 RepID=UPI0009940BB7|nr:AAA family ATPase [Mycobacterium sp. D16R24]
MDSAKLRPLLVVFAGLPGSGKTTVARGLADDLSATFLRVDTIEAAINSTLSSCERSPVGYVAAQWVAEDQLRGGRPVVVDACNNLRVAREMWKELARRTAADLRWVKVICSDSVEHRRRVEERQGDWPGQGDPTWAEVQAREWEPFVEPRLLIDNVGPPLAHRAAIRNELFGLGPE